VRVLWAIKGLGPGGAEQLLAACATSLGLGDGDLEVDVVYLLPYKNALVPTLEAAGVTAHCLGVTRDLDPRWVIRLRKLLAAGRYDVVHTHSPLVAAAVRLVARTLPRRSRPRLVTTEHNPWSTFAWSTRLANGLTAPLDDWTFAVSEETRASIWWRGLRERTEVLVHGIDLDAVAPGADARESVRAELGIGGDEVVVVTVANYRAQKAYDNLLAAAVAAPGIRFVAVGQGPLEGEITALHEQLGLGDRFILTGFRPDARRILAAGDIFTLASHYEGYPVALMEALALGLPVVATAVGGVADAVRDGVEGRLVPPGQPDELAKAIVEVASDASLRRRMASAALARRELFDVRRAGQRQVEVYRSLTSP
jgi:glycosyltransferase involved in cell wall biosynthesis